MNRRPRDWLPAISLVLLAVLSGIGWRVELEMRSGWMSLKWVGYFHWAVPICVAAFIVWVLCVTRVQRRWLFTVALVAFAASSFYVVYHAFYFFLSSGPGVLFSAMKLGRGDIGLGLERLMLLGKFTPIFWALLSLAFFGLCRAFGAAIGWRLALLSAFFFTASWPVAILVRQLFESIGSPDLIHALKSGFIAPFLILSLGYPLLRARALSSHRIEVEKVALPGFG